MGLLGLPFDYNSSFTLGPAKAPDVIRGVLTNGWLNYATENAMELSSTPQWIQSGDVVISQQSTFVEDI